MVKDVEQLVVVGFFVVEFGDVISDYIVGFFEGLCLFVQFGFLCQLVYVVMVYYGEVVVLLQMGDQDGFGLVVQMVYVI